jgi:hypothetical protein
MTVAARQVPIYVATYISDSLFVGPLIVAILLRRSPYASVHTASTVANVYGAAFEQTSAIPVDQRLPHPQRD